MIENLLGFGYILFSVALFSRVDDSEPLAWFFALLLIIGLGFMFMLWSALLEETEDEDDELP